MRVRRAEIPGPGTLRRDRPPVNPDRPGTAFAIESPATSVPDARPGQSRPPARRRVIMADTTVKKIDSAHSPHGAMGQKYLVSGKVMAMRLWEDREPGEPKPAHRR